MGVGFFKSREAYQGNIVVDPLFPLLFRKHMACVQAEGDVIIHIPPGHESGFLENDGDPGIAFYIFSCEIDGSFVRRQKAGADIEEGGLAAARRADQGYEFFFVQLQIDVFQHRQGLLPVPEGFAYIFNHNFHR